MSLISILSEERVNIKFIKMIKDSLALEGFKSDVVYYSEGNDKINRSFERSQAVFCAPGRWLEDSVIKQSRHLKLFQLWSSGYDKFNWESCKKYQIPFATNNSNNSSSVAEHTLFLMLALSRKAYEMNNRALSGNWQGNCNGYEMNMLESRKLFVLGLGNIGKKVASLGLAFGMNVTYYDLIRDEEMEKLGVAFTNIESGLKNSNYITLHLHSNENTQGILNLDRAKLIRHGTYLINVSRANLIEHVALKYLIDKKVLKGVGFDVYDKEPTSGSEYYLTYQNSFFTPHTAGSTYETIEKCIKICSKNIYYACSDQNYFRIKV